MDERIDVLAVMTKALNSIEPGMSPQHDAWHDEMRHACAAVAELIEAASARVAHSFEQARDMDDRQENPVWCLVDVLNPCWKAGMPITTPLRHWGWTPDCIGDGWNACEHCRLRASLARVQGGA